MVVLKRSTTKSDLVPSCLKVTFQVVSVERKGVRVQETSCVSDCPKPLPTTVTKLSQKRWRKSRKIFYNTVLIHATNEWTQNEDYFHESTHLSTSQTTRTSPLLLTSQEIPGEQGKISYNINWEDKI